MRIPASKTAVPELPVEFFPRPALREELARADASQVVVVSAPAGFGKTLLLADWVRSSPTPTAWVTLDADDNEPRRLWAAVLAALRGLPGVPSDSGLRRMDQRGAEESGSSLVDQLTDAIDRLGRPARLVLDDVQELTGAESLRGLARLARRPGRLQLVLASRSDPPISLPRLRLEGRLHGVRADQLRFTFDDTVGLLRASGIDLPESQVSRLHARTEGWVAGLRLAALALRRSDDPETFVAEFSGDEHSVADYLTGEILQVLPEQMRDFLGAVSTCSDLPGALAVELSGRPDADHVLDQLRHDTALVERTAPGVHRIHALLRSYLVANLQRNHPDRFRALQTTAARWWAGQDQRVHALRHAVLGGDRDLLIGLLQRWGVSLLLGGDVEPLQRALAAVDVRGDPWLALLTVITSLEQGSVTAAASELQQVRRSWPATADPELAALRETSELRAAAAGLDVGEPTRARAEDALGPDLRALLHASRATAELAAPGGGSPEVARTELERTVELARGHDFALLEVQSLTLLASLAGVQGDHGPMVSMAQEAVTAAARHGRHPSPWSAGATAILAYAALLAGDPAGARTLAESALEGSDRLTPEQDYALHAVRGAAVADQGERAAGLAEVRAARAAFGDTPSAPWLFVTLACIEHRLALLHGNPRAAEEVAGWLGERAPGVGEAHLLAAWAEAAAGRPGAARAALAPLRGDAVPVLPQTDLEVLLLDIEYALHGGDVDAGRTAMSVALARGEALDVLRPFALAGPCTQRLLGSWSDGAFAARVAAARAAIDSTPAPMLTEREAAVLELLPTLLTASEIADEFTVSVNTVKSHIRSIYAKLGAPTRRDAVAKAVERGLLP